MFARIAPVFLALPLLTSATAIVARGGVPGAGGVTANQCNTGELHCCSPTQSTGGTSSGSAGGLLGVLIGSVGVPIGVNCSPISIVGIAGNSCSAQPACCTGNTFGGLVDLACTPINLNL